MTIGLIVALVVVPRIGVVVDGLICAMARTDQLVSTIGVRTEISRHQ